MTDKCNKYESLFVFGNEEKLQEHIAVCSDCREEHEKMNKTAAIAKEVSIHYKNFGKPKPLQLAIKAVAGVIVIFMAYFVINQNIQNIINNDINGYNLSYSQDDSVVSEMGLPTDDYGLLMVY